MADCALLKDKNRFVSTQVDFLQGNVSMFALWRTFNFITGQIKRFADMVACFMWLDNGINVAMLSSGKGMQKIMRIGSF